MCIVWHLIFYPVKVSQTVTMLISPQSQPLEDLKSEENATVWVKPSLMVSWHLKESSSEVLGFRAAAKAKAVI